MTEMRAKSCYDMLLGLMIVVAVIALVFVGLGG